MANLAPQLARDDETLALVRLSLVPGLGPGLMKALLERFGSAREILQATAADLAGVPHLPSKTADAMLRCASEADLESELATVAAHSARLLAGHQPEFPESLRSIPAPPTLLYMHGDLTAADARAVALVGSRHCTSYGRRITERLARGLVHAGFTVVSGLARGIDGCAHRATLEAGGRTIAVVAGGLAKIYPAEHKDLAKEVAQRGAVLSEAPMKMAPLPEMFPRRNRIISGLALGVVIVEAAEKSGALITAQHAADQGKEVFAVPGPVDQETSAGPHGLIRDGATLVRDVDDILAVLQPQRPTQAPLHVAKAPPPNLPPVQKELWDLLAEGALFADELVQRSGKSAAEVNHAVMMLELAGVLRRLPGNRYERK